MPVYVYHCEGCGTQFEKRQSFTDSPLTECERCHGRLRKVIQPAPIIFKGSGFYSTDQKSKSGGNGGNGTSEKKEPVASGAESSSNSSSNTSSSSSSESPKTPTSTVKE